MLSELFLNFVPELLNPDDHFTYYPPIFRGINPYFAWWNFVKIFNKAKLFKKISPAAPFITKSLTDITPKILGIYFFLENVDFCCENG